MPRALIAESIDMIVFISGRGQARKIETVAQLSGLSADGSYALQERGHLHLTIKEKTCAP